MNKRKYVLAALGKNKMTTIQREQAILRLASVNGISTLGELTVRCGYMSTVSTMSLLRKLSRQNRLNYTIQIIGGGRVNSSYVTLRKIS